MKIIFPTTRKDIPYIFDRIYFVDISLKIYDKINEHNIESQCAFVI